MKLLPPTLLLAVVATTNAVPLTSVPQSSFRLKSHVLTPPNPSFESLYLEPYHVYPSFNYAVFIPKIASHPGIVGHLNGTAPDLANDAGDLVFELGSRFPYSFVIDQVNSTYNPIEILPGSGTRGIFVDQGVIKYHNPISGGFYACNNTLLYGPAVQVFYKPKFITTPAKCSDVELVVEYV